MENLRIESAKTLLEGMLLSMDANPDTMATYSAVATSDKTYIHELTIYPTDYATYTVYVESGNTRHIITDKEVELDALELGKYIDLISWIRDEN